LDMELKDIFALFWEGCLSVSLKGIFISFSNFSKILQWSEFTFCFQCNWIPLIVLSSPNLNFWI
jgi:hypothetical protein